ncbi:conserved hypothetical protein [Burkholderiales bacterium 8X]|nr:conserved hypothetical protein [Burkholderiales bacterium 8X]
MTTLPSIDEVVAFWRDAGPKKWFAKNDAFDAEFKQRFEAAHHAAARGELDEWSTTASGTLALMVLLDQFPRNVFRRSGHMFATDGKALSLARKAIGAGLDQEIEPQLRAFFYLPFMHSEVLADQQRSVELNATMSPESQHFAKDHRDIIERFGRFPHRNPALGRDTTPDEQRFLDEGGFSG